LGFKQRKKRGANRKGFEAVNTRKEMEQSSPSNYLLRP